MMENEKYWKDLISMALRLLIEQKEDAAVSVIRNGKLDVRCNSYDNWNGGIYYWDIVFGLKYQEYAALGDKKSEIEGILDSAISTFHNDEANQIANVMIEAVVERYVDWSSVFPETKESTLQLIEEEHKLLEEIATGRSYKDDGLEESYRIRHNKICSLAKKAGFDYPITSNSLSEWWQHIKIYGTYAERRAYISQLILPIMNDLAQTEEKDTVDFRSIPFQSKTIQQAISDAEMFICNEKYESAVDRIHTAFHGYLRQILDKHHVSYLPDDSIAALYSKLHTFYGSNIHPQEVANRIKDIVRSGSGMVTKINELRNNNTIAHANIQLIQKREAELVIRMINALLNYIEDVESTVTFE